MHLYHYPQSRIYIFLRRSRTLATHLHTATPITRALNQYMHPTKAALNKLSYTLRYQTFLFTAGHKTCFRSFPIYNAATSRAARWSFKYPCCMCSLGYFGSWTKFGVEIQTVWRVMWVNKKDTEDSLAISKGTFDAGLWDRDGD